jgi:hypothetical protein
MNIQKRNPLGTFYNIAKLIVGVKGFDIKKWVLRL